MSKSNYSFDLDDKKSNIVEYDAWPYEEPQIEAKPQRNTILPQRLTHSNVILNNSISEDGELVYYAMLTNTDSVDFKVALKEHVWKELCLMS